MIRDLFVGKTGLEIHDIKATEVAKLPLVGKFTSNGYEVEIVSFNKISGSHSGVEFFVKASKNGVPVGFGKEGKIETERIRMFGNIPLDVLDPLGDIVSSYEDVKTKLPKEQRSKENPIKAIREDLAHTISLIAKDGKNIVRGSIGNTTSTFYPEASGSEVNSCDGDCGRYVGAGETWATYYAATGNSPGHTTSPRNISYISCGPSAGKYDNGVRGFFLFYTAAIPDGDSISSAVLSVYGDDHNDTLTQNVAIYLPTTASNTSIANGDFDMSGWGTTIFSNSISCGSWTNGGYNDFTLNASGIANITKTGTSKFGTMLSCYATNTEPTWGSGKYSFVSCQMAEGANKPKLVVEHASGGGSTNTLSSLALMGVGM